MEKSSQLIVLSLSLSLSPPHSELSRHRQCYNSLLEGQCSSSTLHTWYHTRIHSHVQHGGENLEILYFLVISRLGSSEVCARQSAFAIGDRKLRNRAGGRRTEGAVLSEGRRLAGHASKLLSNRTPLFRACVPLKIEGSRGGRGRSRE